MKNWMPLFFIISATSFAGNRLQVVCTTADPAALAKIVGGEWVETEALALGSRDPHFARAKPSMIRRISSADLFILIGADLETGWVPALLNASRNPQISVGSDHYLDLSKHIPILDIPTGPVTRAMGDVHPLGNPHYWLDPENGILMAKAIADRLAILDPEHADEFHSNFESWRTGFESKIGKWKERVQALGPLKVLAFHTSFRYLEHAFGIQIAGFVEPKPGIAPGPKYLTHLQEQIREENLKYILMETYYPRKGPDFLARNTGIKVLVLPQSVGATPQTKTYSDVFEGIVKLMEETR